MKRESGMITVDFLFAFVLVFGFTMVLFSLAFSLSMAEVTQYITFATARTYSAGHGSPAQQHQLALEKYNSLLSHPVFRPLFTNGWFEVDGEPEVGDLSQLFPEYAGGTINYFVGAGTNFTARMLDLKIPFYGSTSSQGDEGRGFNTFIASYLGREPTSSECLNFKKERWTHIKRLDAAYSTTPNKDSDYVPIADDGC